MPVPAPSFAFLTPPHPSALACVRIWCARPDSPFTRGTPPIDHNQPPLLVELAGTDTGLCGRSPDGSLWFTPHGGPGVRAAIQAALLARGFRETTSSESDSDFEVALQFSGLKPNLYRRTILSMLPFAASPAAATLLLRALQSPVPPHDAFMPGIMAAAWPGVSNWLSRPLVVLIGPPNAGKSTLFNLLVDDGAAIVSSDPGTTRDVLTGPWTLPNGAVVELADTPGVRDPDGTTSPGELAGIEIAREWAQRAACRLVLAPCDCEHEPHLDGLHIGTMCDIHAPPGWADLCVSSVTRFGIDSLTAALMGHLFPDPPMAIIPLSGAMALDMAKPGGYDRWFGNAPR